MAPIVLFVFARPQHTARTLSALRANELAADSDLVVYADGPRSERDRENVAEVRALVREASGFRSVSIVERQENLGLARNIVDGVSAVCAERGHAIVIEDDIVTSPWFLRYMNQALDLYADVEAVASIHGYTYPTRRALPETFFLRGADCWGWGTWKRAWQNFNPDGVALLAELEKRQLTRDFDLQGAYGFTDMLRAQIRGDVNSWAIRWHASMFLADKLTLYPGHSLVDNIGHDGNGTHCAANEVFAVCVQEKPVRVNRIPLKESAVARREFGKFLRGRQPTWAKRVRRFLSHKLRAI